MERYQYIIGPFLSYSIAQVIKLLLTYKAKKRSIYDIFRSGGMPSSHTAFTVSLTTILAINQGFDSISFAIMLAITSIVAYDSLNVRRTVGDYSEIIKSLPITKNFANKKIHHTKGHNFAEVSAGFILGLVVGVVVVVVL